MFEVVISLGFFCIAIYLLWPYIVGPLRYLTHYVWKCDHKGKRGQDYVKDVPAGVWYYKCKGCLHKLESGPL